MSDRDEMVFAAEVRILCLHKEACRPAESVQVVTHAELRYIEMRGDGERATFVGDEGF